MPVTPRRRWGTRTDAYVAMTTHRLLSSTMCSNDDIDLPVHSLMLSFHDLRGLPLRLRPIAQMAIFVLGNIVVAFKAHVRLDGMHSCVPVIVFGTSGSKHLYDSRSGMSVVAFRIVPPIGVPSCFLTLYIKAAFIAVISTWKNCHHVVMSELFRGALLST